MNFRRIVKRIGSRLLSSMPVSAQAATRGKVALARAKRARRPLVSIIVPIYNVEKYLEECLDSISHQSYRQLEIIAVNDGSQDRSAEILARKAHSDIRIRVFSQTNAGLGAARNYGLRFARGKYLVFVDSDDTLPPKSVEVMVSAAERDHAQMVVGALQRFEDNDGRKWIPAWAQEAHSAYRHLDSIESFLPLLRNHYTHSKLYSRTFWQSERMQFREGVAYEDQPIVLALYCAATSITAVPDTVYRYRVRQDGSSISQQTGTVPDLRDRVAAWQATLDMFAQRTQNPLVFNTWLRDIYTVHLHWYLNNDAILNDEFWGILKGALEKLDEVLSEEMWHQVDPKLRLPIEFLRQNDRERVQDYRFARGYWKSDHKIIERHGELFEDYVLDPRGSDDGKIWAAENLKTQQNVRRLERITTEAGTVTKLAGFAFIIGLDSSAHIDRSLIVRNSLTGRSREIPLKSVDDDSELLPKWNYRRVSSANVGYEVTLADNEVVELASTSAEHGESAVIDFDYSLKAGPFGITVPVSSVYARGSAGHIQSFEIAEGTCTVSPVNDEKGGRYKWNVVCNRGETVGTVDDGIVFKQTDASAVRARSINFTGDALQILVEKGNVDRAVTKDDEFGAVSGWSTELRSASLKIKGKIEPLSQNLVKVEFPASAFLDSSWPNVAQLRSYELHILDNGVTDYVVHTGDELVAQMPFALIGRQFKFRCLSAPDGRIEFALRPPLSTDTAGLFNEQRLISISSSRPKSKLRGTLLRSYFGEHVTCNAKALAQGLVAQGYDEPILLGVKHGAVSVPKGTTPVVIGSQQWFDAIATSDVYLDNMYQSENYRMPEGQRIVQTFHGYPFKLMGHGHWESTGHMTRRQIVSYDRRAAEWSYLVSPAPYATPLLQREFAYHGAVLEIGYPRNDDLYPDGRGDERRAQIRKRLNIRDDQCAVLYVPTFRDWLSPDNNTAKFFDPINMGKLATKLGSDFKILVRGHAFNARAKKIESLDSHVVDVTMYPEINDLYLASDVGIFDYSSARFDFAVTGKPMVFFVPDLEQYKQSRGTLMPFEPTAPGPQVNDFDELVTTLEGHTDITQQYKEQYATFRRDYIPLEDGQATLRLINALYRK